MREGRRWVGVADRMSVERKDDRRGGGGGGGIRRKTDLVE